MADNNPYGLLGGVNASTPYTPTMGNGSIFVPPGYMNMPASFGYANITDQLTDAARLWGQGAGAFTGNASPVMQTIKNGAPTVGGGTLGATAYSGNNPWTGFNPYAGRGNGPGPGGPTVTPGAPPAGDVFNPARRPYTGAPVAPVSPHGGAGVPLPFQAPNPRAPQQPTAQPTAQPGGLLGPRSTEQPTAAPPAAPMAMAPQAPAAPGANGGIDSYVQTFMSLPPEQRGDYFNAISQYGLMQGQNLGGQLDDALRHTMGADQTKNWLQNVDDVQGSTIKSTAGLPDWLIKGLGG